ncbi:(d)CMP kinase [Croceicoccus mobilis]|uniref:Cytidylate kinase n=1 Tax=Croceicoccus mobilis TaxID=1703339 RepID=A0A917DX31_9SPHN|nr:(d)CMP kinase [Croceicoccus mobilis]GGD75988.1 cytidylate kinase [Croceicoccus mobilis]
MIIAIDGPIGSGKKGIALFLARHFSLPHLSSGLLYRAVAFQLMQIEGDADSEADALAACDFDPLMLEEPELQAEYIGGLASRIAVHPRVRKTLFERQWRFAHRPGGCIMDGRDIGTAIAPDADAKLFLAADFDARLRRINRRYRMREDPLSIKEVAIDISLRDDRDTMREASPLRQAVDAVLLDTSHLDDEEANQAALRIVEGLLAWPPPRQGLEVGA